MPIDHYENFPVASVLLPRHLRTAVTNIYRFARTADDIADEGDATPSERLAQLKMYRQALHGLISPSDNAMKKSTAELSRIFTPLGKTIAKHQLPLTPFYDLLSAFEQDVTQVRYADYATLSDYCRRSANPVGLLMLHLYECVDDTSKEQSDAICTALQLVNFLQDVAIDWKKGRIYLPQADMNKFGVTEAIIATSTTNSDWRALMQFEADRCRTLLKSGLPLGKRLKGRLGLELRLIIHGGLRIIDKLEAVRFDVFKHRPTLRAADWGVICWRACINK
jgi:squalene synthase HpnC